MLEIMSNYAFEHATTLKYALTDLLIEVTDACFVLKLPHYMDTIETDYIRAWCHDYK